MDNEQLLAQIVSLLEEQTASIDKKMAEQTAYMDRKMSEQTLQINLKIENEVTKRIDSLFDGYKQNLEQQCELKQDMELLERRVDTLEVKVG